MAIDLPYIDEHEISIPVPRDQVWTALYRYVTTSTGASDGRLLTRFIATEPPSGFQVAEEVPDERITLAGCHRFSRYALVFAFAEVADRTTMLRAKTHAAFPGLGGQAYRAMVIGTRVHVLATRHMLTTIQRLNSGMATS